MKSKKTIAVIWAIFAVLFGILTIWHLYASQQKISHIQIAELVPGGKALAVADLSGDCVDVEAPIREFAKKFNQYLDSQNQSNQFMNYIAAFGYLLACLMAIVSLILEWPKVTLEKQ